MYCSTEKCAGGFSKLFFLAILASLREAKCNIWGSYSFSLQVTVAEAAPGTENSMGISLSAYNCFVKSG